MGNITVEMGAGEPKVFFPVMNLNNSGLCGFDKSTASSSSGSSQNSDDSDKHSHKHDHNAGEHVHTSPVYTMVLCAVFAEAIWSL